MGISFNRYLRNNDVSLIGEIFFTYSLSDIDKAQTFFIYQLLFWISAIPIQL